MICPICGKLMFLYFNTDAALCPTDGVMTGLELANLEGQPKYIIIAEIRASQALREIRQMADKAREVINGNCIVLDHWLQRGNVRRNPPRIPPGS